MTNNVAKGANRAASSAKRTRAAQRTPLPPKGATSAPSKADSAAVIKEVLEETKPKPAAKGKPVPADYKWIADKSYGENVHLAREAKVPWRRIAEIASANAHDTPWPDGGKLLRAQKAFLAGTEGAPKTSRPRRASGGTAVSDGETERVYRQGAVRTDGKAHTWDDQQVIASVKGRRIYWTNGVSGAEHNAAVPSSSNRVRVRIDPHKPEDKRVLEFPELIEIGEDGVERLGPLRTVRLSSITVIE